MLPKAKNIRSANGLRGTLIAINGDVSFRVYDEQDKSRFTDYSIAHSNLEIMIQDDDAYIYESQEDDSDPIIDHSPQTLGLPG